MDEGDSWSSVAAREAAELGPALDLLFLRGDVAPRLAVSAAHQGDPAQSVALTVVVAQAVMIVALGSLPLWIGFAGVLRPACARPDPSARPPRDLGDLMEACA